jgi:hypothetical protein
MGHAAPSEDGISQAKLIAKDWQARCLFHPKVATKRFSQTEQPFFGHRANYSHTIIRQGPSGPGIVKQICSPFVKASPPLPIVGRTSASVPYTDSSSVWIALALSPLSVKKQTTGRCSI